MQARKAQEAEEAAERARLAEAEARRVAAQVQAVQNRQLRDAVAWLRASAKWPKESLPRFAPAPCVLGSAPVSLNSRPDWLLIASLLFPCGSRD